MFCFQIKSLFVIIALGLIECDGAKILAFLPLGSHSHQNTFRPVFRGLAKRGHDITYVTSIPDKNAPYKQIIVRDQALEKFESKFNP